MKLSNKYEDQIYLRTLADYKHADTSNDSNIYLRTNLIFADFI